LARIGDLIVFEGPDGVGKSELAARFFKFMQQFGHSTELMSFPGKRPGTLGNLVYRLHHKPEEFGVASISPASMQVLHIAAHVDAIERQIIPALTAGTHVILDRYWWSTLVYGLAGGADKNTLEQMISVEKLAWKGIRPLIVFLIDRSGPLRAEPLDFWLACRRHYSDLLSTERTHYPCHVVENQGRLDETEAVIIRFWENAIRSRS
jgi:thymidylate kinase